MKWYHQMQNKIKNFLLILGLFLFAKLLLIPILLFIEIINISRLSNIFNFVFDYALFGTAFFLGFCNLFLTKFERGLNQISSNLPRLGLYFAVCGWIPIASVLYNQFNRYLVQAILVSFIAGVILDKAFPIWKKAILIVILFLILALIFTGNSIYEFDE